MSLLALLMAVGLVVLIFRNNVLAYVGTAFCLPLAEPLASFFAQPAAFFRLNGLLLAVFVCIVLAWMFLARGGSTSQAPAGD